MELEQFCDFSCSDLVELEQFCDFSCSDLVELEQFCDFSCSDLVELEQFFNWYRQFHGQVAVAVCILGIVANSANIVVLTRPSMRSPINYILTGLAVSDGLTMTAYVPFAMLFYVLYGVELSVERNTLSAARFLLFYARFSVVVHTASIWLTVVLATFRYVIVRSVTWYDRCSKKTHIVVSVLVSKMRSLRSDLAISYQSKTLPNSSWTIMLSWLIRANVWVFWGDIDEQSRSQ